MPLNVLLADDSVPAQNMGKKILVDAGYDVLTVSNGLEALRKIADSVPDIAILDIFMPGYSGLEICERLRANAATANIPVILTVGKLEPYRPEDGEHVHSNAVIVKPFSPEELISAVRSLVGESTPAAPEVPPPPAEVPVAEVAPQQEEAAKVEDSEDEAEEEPLFYYGSLDDPSEISGLQTSSEMNATVDVGTNSDGPASLVFNPDAASTPFSASAIELMPSVPETSEEGPSAFAEFSMESATPPAVEEDAPEAPASEESSLVTETQDAAVTQIDETPYVATEADVELEDSSPASVQPEFTNTPEPIAPVSLEASNHESEGPDLPAHDPSLDVQEADASIAVLSPDVDSHASVEPQSSEKVHTEDFASAGEDEYEAPISPEEEARREAFERLFNSPDSLPLENYSPEPVAIASSVFPGIAESFEHHPSGIAADSEIESPVVGEPQFVAPELDPYLMEEEAPIDAIGTIPDRDQLLDGSLTENEWPVVASLLGSEEVMVSAPTEISEPEKVPVEQASQPVPDDAESVVPDAVEGLAPEEAPIASVECIEPEIATEPEQSVEPEQVVESEQVVEPEQAVELEQSVEAEQPVELEQCVQPAEPEQLVEPEQPTVDIETQPEILPEELQALTDTLVPEETKIVPEYVHSEAVLEAASGLEAAPESELPVADLISDTSEAPEVISAAPLETPEPVQAEPEVQVEAPTFAAPLQEQTNDAERIQQAIERVFDRIKPLLVEAIVREMARPTE